MDVDIKRLLLCTGGHAVFLRAVPLVFVIIDVLDYKLLQHRNNCRLFLGMCHLSKGIQKVNLFRELSDINHTAHDDLFNVSCKEFTTCGLFHRVSKTSY